MIAHIIDPKHKRLRFAGVLCLESDLLFFGYGGDVWHHAAFVFEEEALDILAVVADERAVGDDRVAGRLACIEHEPCARCACGDL